MRQIKFRGKTLQSYGSEWIYGSLVKLSENNYGIIQEKDVSFDEGGYVDYSHTPVATDTVGQFTGLLDKNGKEIYEGDIIKYLDYDDNDLITLINTVIEYYKGCFVYFLTCGKRQLLGTTDKYDFEIIGNIHDNPELLKGGEE